MSLPNQHRLRRRDNFNRVYRRGIRRKTRHLTLRAVQPDASVGDRSISHEKITQGKLSVGQSTHVRSTRLGISISQKVSKRAVVRNRIKRQIKAAFRHLLPSISPGWHLVVSVHPNAIQCDYEQFLQELKQLLVDAEVIHGHSGRCLL